MRCLLLTNHFYPESFRCNDVAFELVKRGYEVTVLTAIPDYPQGRFHKGYSLFKKRCEQLNGVKVVRVPIIPRGNGRPFRMLLNYGSGIFFFFFHALYQGVFHKYDCIFVHDTSPAFIGLPAVLVKKIQGIPMDFWILDMWPQSLAAGGIRNARIYRWIDCMMDFIYRNSTMIHISSLGFRQLLRLRNVPDEKIEYLPNWSDDSIVHTHQVNIPVLPDGFIIMFAGNLGEAQNLENVLEAAHLLKEKKEVHWIFLGDGRKKAWMEQYIAEHHLESTVHLLGRFPIESMPSFFEKADVMLVSLADEQVFNLTLPAKVQAYMSCSKPILAMLNGEGQEIIHRAACGWSVDAMDVEGLVHKIQEIVRLPKDKLTEIGKNGYQYYMQHFQKKICMDIIDHALKSMAIKFKGNERD